MKFISGEISYTGKTSGRVALILLLLISLVVRLFRLNDGLWLDEILTFVNYARLPFSAIVTTFDSENQHFLYSLLAHASFLTFGESAWALRLPAVIFGLGSIWAIYRLGLQVTTEQESLLAAALLAFSYHHVWFSQNARGYTGMLFWMTLSSWLLLKALKENRTKVWILYAVSSALGIYTHLTMLFAVAGQFVVFLIWFFWQKQVTEKRWSGFILGFGLTSVLALLLHAFVIQQILETTVTEGQTAVPFWLNPLWTLKEIVSRLSIGLMGGIFLLGAFVLFGAGLLSYARSYPAIIGLLVLPPLLGAIAVIGAGHHLWPRFFFYLAGLGVLVVVRGGIILGSLAGRLLKLSTKNTMRLATAFPIIIITFSALSVPLAYGPKQDYQGALDFVKASIRPGDEVVTVSLTAIPYQAYYQTDWVVVSSLKALDDVRTRSNRTWLVYTFPPVLEAQHPDIMVSIKKDFPEVKRFEGTVSGGTIFVNLADNDLGISNHNQSVIPNSNSVAPYR